MFIDSRNGEISDRSQDKDAPPSAYLQDMSDQLSQATVEYASTYWLEEPVLRFKITAIIDNPAGDWLLKNDIRLCVKMTRAGDFRQAPLDDDDLEANGDMRVDTVIFYGSVAEGKFVSTRTLA